MAVADTTYPCANGCGKVRGEHSVDGVCRECARGVIRELRRLQDKPPMDLVMIVSSLQDWGAPKCAEFVIGVLPFQERRNHEP